MSRNIIIASRIDRLTTSLVRLLLICMVFSCCHGENEKVGPLQETYELREDIKKGEKLFCAVLPYPTAKYIEIPIYPFKPLKTTGKVNTDGTTFCVLLDDVLFYKAKDSKYVLDVKFFDSSKQYLGKKVVTIVLLQVNRYRPRFESYNDTLDLEEEEETGHGKLLNLNATDEDDRDTLAYSIQNTNVLDGKFNLNTERDLYGNYAELMNSVKLDYELKTYYRIEVIVSDNAKNRIKYGERHTSTATIHVNVIDIDDQLPVFQKECGIAKIKENSIREVSRVHAIDGDRGINHPIGYALGNG